MSEIILLPFAPSIINAFTSTSQHYHLKRDTKMTGNINQQRKNEHFKTFEVWKKRKKDMEV